MLAVESSHFLGQKDLVSKFVICQSRSMKCQLPELWHMCGYALAHMWLCTGAFCGVLAGSRKQQKMLEDTRLERWWWRALHSVWETHIWNPVCNLGLSLRLLPWVPSEVPHQSVMELDLLRPHSDLEPYMLSI